MKRVIEFVKKETILSIASLLAIGSAFFVHPDQDYVSYIDYRVLGILLSLMLVMEGLTRIGFFETIGDALLKRCANVRMLCFLLIMLCFFGSMLITNDVALLTFVPFAILILKQAQKEKLLIPVLVLQTIAANLGSMLTPIGNPQNLYLYNTSGWNPWEFMKVMLPYCAISFFLLSLCCLFFPHQNIQVSYLIQQQNKRHSGGENRKNNTQMQHIEKDCKNPDGTLLKGAVILYLALFLLCLMVVLRWIPFYVALVVVIIAVFVYDRKILCSVDYCLLLTFVAFFIFIGNMGRVESIRTLLQNLITGHEMLLGVVTSQFVSNVPATLLLASFTKEYESLLIGVNLGGLGKLIASMASLISFKLYAHQYNKTKGRYFLWFTAGNIGFLIILLLAFGILH